AEQRWDRFVAEQQFKQLHGAARCLQQQLGGGRTGSGGGPCSSGSSGRGVGSERASSQQPAAPGAAGGAVCLPCIVSTGGAGREHALVISSVSKCGSTASGAAAAPAVGGCIPCTVLHASPADDEPCGSSPDDGDSNACDSAAAAAVRGPKIVVTGSAGRKGPP
ncbi:hypothetical protein MNEG_10961, partial [Monoraphidium neglectum]